MTATVPAIGPPAALDGGDPGDDPGDDLIGRALADWRGVGGPLFLRTTKGRRLRLDLSTYFAPVTPIELLLLDRAAGLVVDVGCGPARHARLLQARGLQAVGLDRSAAALSVARRLGLRRTLEADVLHGPLPSGIGASLLLDGNLGLAGSLPVAARLLGRLADAAAPGGRLLVDGRAPAGHRHRRLELRGEYLGAAGPWFGWLLVGLPTLVGLAAVSGWRLELALTQGRRYWAWFTCAR
jgi:SAM-dependent methyltransferase